MVKLLLLALVVAFSVSNPIPDDQPLEEQPSDEKPVQPPVVVDDAAGAHFCCKSVTPEKRTGEGCVLANNEQLAACSVILYCPGFYTLVNGVVSCPK